MFDIRKIQENVIYESVKAQSNADTANEVVYGNKQQEIAENNADWVNSSCNLVFVPVQCLRTWKN